MSKCIKIVFLYDKGWQYFTDLYCKTDPMTKNSLSVMIG